MTSFRKMIANTKAGLCPECGKDHAWTYWIAVAILLVVVVGMVSAVAVAVA